VVNDSTAAGGALLHNPDAGAAKLSNALASPGTYVEMQFSAQAGVAYRLWIRGKAQGNDPRPSSPDEFKARIAGDIEKWTTVVASANQNHNRIFVNSEFIRWGNPPEYGRTGSPPRG